MAIRAPLDFTGALTGGSPNVRSTLIYDSALTGGQPNVRSALIFTSPLTGGNPNVRCALIFTQALIAVPEELPVATAIFPVLRGLTWDKKKNPRFNTAKRAVTSGRVTRTAFMQYPVWDFELSYDYLPDITPGVSGYTDLRTLQGFFLQMQGSFQAWLFRDKDDNQAVGSAIATADGVTLQWPFMRNFGGFSEPVGQIDLSALASFASTAVNTSTDAINVPAHGLATGQGPAFISTTGSLPSPLIANTAYWVIAVDADHFQLATSLANALALTAINLTTAGSGNDTLTKGIAVYDNGTLVATPAVWSLTLPNQLVFVSAPTAGHLITADFDFYFVCNFTDDTTQFNQFMSKLWDLQKIDFESVIQ
jgi:hypothetical protein